MYTAFYGLREKPFALSPDPRFLYLAGSHREALAHLLYGIEQGEGFISVTGEVGTGKTTLCRTLLERLEEELEVAFLFNPSRTALELLQTICAEFDLPAEGLARRSLMAQLNGFLLEKKSEGRRVLLIIDEAQTLSANTLEQVRLLSNLETSREKLIQILLLGQPELDRKLDEQGLRQLRQRISVRWELDPLEVDETKAYVRHRIAVAAGEPKELFTDAALREVHRRTGGIPRLVNQLCDRSLLAGFAARAAEIGPRLIRAAAKEIPDARRPRGLPAFGRPTRPWQYFAGLFVLVGLGLLAVLQAGYLTLGGTDSARAEKQAPPPVAAAPPDQLPAASHAVVSPPIPATQTFLRALTARDPVAMLGESEAALLTGFGRSLTDRASPAHSGAALEASLNERGLVTTAFTGGSLALLGRLEHPVALAMHPEGSARSDTLRAEDRWVALLGIEGDRLRLAGLHEGREMTVSQKELAQYWTQSGLIVWERYERIPESLTIRDLGASVVWLQTALSEIGFFRGKPTGQFDQATFDALSSFQRDRGLVADGIVGPLTQIALFGQLSRYPVPRLSAVEGRASEGVSPDSASSRAYFSAREGGERG